MYDASQGRGSGGNINVVLRSGTDKLHGGIFEFYRSNDFNANDFFLNAQSKPTPTLIQNQFGGTLRWASPKVEGYLLVFLVRGHAASERRIGNNCRKSACFSRAQRLGRRKPQYATALQTAFFPSGMPTGTFIDPVAVNLFSCLVNRLVTHFRPGSCAGLTNCSVGTLAGRIALSVPTDYNEDQYVGTVDRNLFRNKHLAAQLFWANISQITPTGGGSTLGQGVTTLSKNEHAALTDTETFTSNLMNEARAGFTYLPSVRRS